MIDELHVENLALIHEADLSPASGMTVITGETGAGKTALLGALKLLAGERAEAALVREGEDGLRVEGRLFLASVPEGEGEDWSSEGVVVSRSISVDGRSRVRVNGRMSQVGRLSKTVGASIDLCGQHEHQRLLKASNHRGIFDAWLGEELLDSLEAYRAAFFEAREAESAVSEIQAARNLSEEQVGQARYVLSRIDEVGIVDGEYERLCELVPKIENSEMLMDGVDGARNALSGDGGALEALATAAQLLEQASLADAALGELAASLREASYVVEDVAMDVRRYRDDLDFDPSQLEQMQDRMGQLQGLMRIWGPTMGQVIEAREEAARVIASVDGFSEQMALARKRLDQAEGVLADRARTLHALRASHASRFGQMVSAQMSRLMLGGASLQCQVEMLGREAWSADGPSRVEFLFRPGEGMSARPLGKIASGGEVSRVMLAIKVVLGACDQAETLVFDEVDAGVGGAAAVALAQVLADLARTHQVIVVTHLAQLAVMAQVHYVASKTMGLQPETTFARVDGEARIEELSRMLSGGTGEASMEHARELLAQVRLHVAS